MDNHGETITIAEPNVLTQTRTEAGKRLRMDYEAHKITKQRKYMQQYEARTDGVTNTLTSVQKDNMVVEPMASVHPLSHTLEFNAEALSNVSPCLRATEAKAVTCAWKKNESEPPFRIRRLIPRECFRLMDVTDEDYDKINTYIRGYRKNGTPIRISESQQYKLAGNSIVVACMYYIFESLFFPADAEITEPKQLDIFDIIE